MNELYQIGVPVDQLSVVMMLWNSYEKPCSLFIRAAKTEGFAIVELRHVQLSAEIIKTLPESKVNIQKIAVKNVKI